MYKTASVELFRSYPNEVFIESGSFIGDGIQCALCAGFKTIYSIEISESLYLKCVERFRDKDNVHLIHGDSPLILNRLLSDINVPITFWLDGHNSGTDGDTGIVTTYGKYERPLIYELDIIQRHHIKTHTLIIDDLRLWTMEENGFDIKTIIEKCLEINSQYEFTFRDGYIKNDILIAWVW